MRTGGQAAVAGVPAAHRADPRLHAGTAADSAVQRHVPRDGEGLQGALPAQAVRHQPHGRAHAKGHHPVLCLCRGAAKGGMLCNFNPPSFPELPLFAHHGVVRALKLTRGQHERSRHTGALPEHAVQQAADQSVDHLLQQREPC